MYPIIVLLLLQATASPDAGPLTAQTAVIDRGDVRTGPPLETPFELTHTGTAGTIIITGIDSACGCLQPTPSRTTLKPGERCRVAVVVNTLTQPAGPNAWRAVVRYRLEDGPEQRLRLQVSARLIQEVSVDPPQVELSTAGTAGQTLSVRDRRSTPLEVRSASTTNPHLAVIVHPSRVEAGVSVQPIELKLGADCPPGRTDETVVLVTSDPGCRELRIPVRVTKRTAVDVASYPETLEVRLARGQSVGSGFFQVRRPAGGAVRIENVECRQAGVSIRWTKESGPVATVRVVVDAGKARVSGRSEVRVVLADPPGQVLTVPISWIIP